MLPTFDTEDSMTQMARDIGDRLLEGLTHTTICTIATDCGIFTVFQLELDRYSQIHRLLSMAHEFAGPLKEQRELAIKIAQCFTELSPI